MEFTEKEAMNLIEIGVDVGMFTTIGIMLEGINFDRKTLQAVSDLCAKSIEELTGMPAEDFALKVKPSIEKIIKQAKESN